MNNAIQTLFRTHQYLKRYGHHKVIPAFIRETWAKEALSLLNFEIQTQGTIQEEGPLIFVANHISYTDIPLLMATLGDCSFVAKKEVKLWPLFGKAAVKLDTIFVQRSSKSSRKRARQEIEHQLLSKHKRIVIFPSGTTSIQPEKTWKKGVFEVAKDLGIPVQRVRINYSSLRKVAYIDDDFFPTHLYRLSKEDLIKASVQIAKPIIIQDVARDLELCRTWCNTLADDPSQESVLNPLPSHDPFHQKTNSKPLFSEGGFDASF